MTNKLRLIGMLTAVLAIAASASAQIAQPTLRSSRPARGLFGGGLGETEQSLIFSASVGGGYDKSEGGQFSGAPVNPATETPGWTGGHAVASTSLSYSISRGRVHGGAGFDAQGQFRDNGFNNSFNGMGFSGNVGMDIASRTSISMSQGLSRQPRNMDMFYGNWFDSSEAPNNVFDLSGATSVGDYVTSQTAVTFSHGVTSRISLLASYWYHTYFAPNELTTSTDSKASSAAIGVSYQIARGVHFRIGYGSTTARYGESADPVKYSGLVMDGGLVFDRALSLTRKSSLSFSTGLTGARDEGGHMFYYVTGRATLSYELGRSWTAALNYRRGVDFNQGLGQPIVLDTASVGISGDLGRRFQAGGQSGGSWGTMGIHTEAGRFDAFTSSAYFRTAISREIGVTLHYAFRHYVVDDPASLPPGMLPGSDRQTIRATLDMWFPLFIRARRTN